MPVPMVPKNVSPELVARAVRGAESSAPNKTKTGKKTPIFFLQTGKEESLFLNLCFGQNAQPFYL